jgi:cGMP-dependent protein kinase
LIDFGTAKLIEGRTFTIVGTPHYMAPEVVLGKGYTHGVDVWSLGVMLFEFICGGVPFGEEEDDPFMIYERILRDSLRFPSNIAKSTPLRSFLELVLNKNPALRLQSGISRLKEHQWLYGFDWVRVYIGTNGRKAAKTPSHPQAPQHPA